MIIQSFELYLYGKEPSYRSILPSYPIPGSRRSKNNSTAAVIQIPIGRFFPTVRVNDIFIFVLENIDLDLKLSHFL